MKDIFFALMFAGMVAYPAVVASLPWKKNEDEAHGLRDLSLALAHAKQMPAKPSTSSR
jgi:hypothetical protein